MQVNILFIELLYKLKTSVKLTFLVCGFISFTSLANTGENVDKYYEKAVIAFQEGKANTSIIHLKNALQNNDGHIPSRLLLAKAYIEIGDGSSAEVELLKARDGNADRESLVSLFARAYLLQSKFDKVLDVTKAGDREANLEAELLIYRGQALIGQKLYRSADIAFKDALLLSPNNQMALLGRAQMALHALKPQQALNYIETALNRIKPFINGWILKSSILNQMGDINGALVAIDKALEIDSTHMLARLNKAMLHINLQEFSLAEPHIDFI